MGKILVCGHCKTGTDFLGYIKKQAQMKFDGTSEIPTVIREGKIEAFEVAQCLNCKQKVTNDNLIEMMECTECKTLVLQTDTDENGVCLTCIAAKTHPDLLNMSQAELIKMIIQLEKGQGKKAAAITQTVAKAEEIQDSRPTDEELAQKRSEAAKKAAITKKRNALIAKGVPEDRIDEDGNEIPTEDTESVDVDLPIDTSKQTNEPVKDWVAEARDAMIQAAAEKASEPIKENDENNPIDNLVAPPPTLADDEPF